MNAKSHRRSQRERRGHPFPDRMGRNRSLRTARECCGGRLSRELAPEREGEEAEAGQGGCARFGNRGVDAGSGNDLLVRDISSEEPSVEEAVIELHPAIRIQKNTRLGLPVGRKCQCGATGVRNVVATKHVEENLV